MPISDLTGTKWVLNTAPSVSIDQTFDVEFTSNSTNYIMLGIDDRGKIGYYTTPFNFINAWQEGSWSNQAYRIISITGGTDATNSTLISWLTNNATQVPVVDLSGTTWLLNSTIEYDSNFPTYSINYKAYYNNGANYDLSSSLYMYMFSMGGVRGPVSGPTFYGLRGDDLYSFNGAMISTCIYEGANTTTMTPTSNLNTLDYIEITSGTDTTNPDLIVWLTNNATYQAPPAPASGGIFIGNNTISAMYVGNSEVSKVYLGNELVYEKSTPSGYQVTFTASEDWYNADIGGVQIYDGQDNTGVLLLNQSPADKSAFPMTFNISSGYCCVELSGNNILGGVSTRDYIHEGDLLYHTMFYIDKNGTIDLGIYDFDD